MYASDLRTYFVQRNFVCTKSIHWEEILVCSYNDPRTFRLVLVLALTERKTLNGRRKLLRGNYFTNILINRTYLKK